MCNCKVRIYNSNLEVIDTIRLRAGTMECIGNSNLRTVLNI